MHAKTSPQDGRSVLRARMVEQQLYARGIKDARLLAAMEAVPRDLFVPHAVRARAYDDTALPIAEDQTISQPYVVAMMLEIARLTGSDRVLEVGAGSGYLAAVMAHLVRHVTSVERHLRLVTLARSNLARAGIANVTIVAGDGTRGLPHRAPFDVIVVSAGGPLPNALAQQLAVGGRLVMPRGDASGQRLVRLTRGDTGTLVAEDFGAVSFVPLVTDAERGAT